MGPSVLHSCYIIWLLRPCRRGFGKVAPWILEDLVRAGEGWNTIADDVRCVCSETWGLHLPYGIPLLRSALSDNRCQSGQPPFRPHTASPFNQIKGTSDANFTSCHMIDTCPWKQECTNPIQKSKCYTTSEILMFIKSFSISLAFQRDTTNRSTVRFNHLLHSIPIWKR